MIKANSIFTITKKEIRSYFNNPATYLVVVVFLLLWEFLFFRQAFLIGEASLRLLFSLLPWLLLIFIPALTMGLISKEKSESTLELLLTRPINEIELLLGKFLGALFLATTALAFAWLIAVSFARFGHFDWGVFWGQFLGSVLMMAVFISLGLFLSSLLSSQIAALLTSVALSFLLLMIGSEVFTAVLPLPLSGFLTQLSITSHFNSMSRGVIDIRDLWYFVSAPIAFLSLAYLSLLKIKMSPNQPKLRSFQAGILLLTGVVVLSNVLGSKIPGRIDLTSQKLYTLSPVTQKVVSALDDVVNITLYASDQMPAQFQPVLRDTKDLLKDYQALNQGKIVLQFKDPAGNQEVAQEAQSLGLKQVQFNVVGQEELQLKKGFLGLVVSHAAQNETIPFIKDTSDLEYQITSFIKKLTVKNKKKVAFLTGHGEKSLFADYRLFSQELQKLFETKELEVNDKQKQVGGDVSTLVVAGPTRKVDQLTRTAIKKYIDGGGSVFFLIDALNVTPQALMASQNANSLADLVAEYGVKVNSDLIYDLRSNETVSFGGGQVNFLVPYPLWVKAQAKAGHLLPTSRVENLLLPWVSSLSLDEQKLKGIDFSAETLFTTTRFGGRQTSNFNLAPDQTFSQQALGEQILAVGLSQKIKDQSKKAKVRLIVVGDSDFLTDQFLKNSPENLAFGLQAVSFLSQEDSLAGIGLKQRTQPKLLFENAGQVVVVKYGNLGAVLFLPVVFAVFRLRRRRNLAKLSYEVKS